MSQLSSSYPAQPLEYVKSYSEMNTSIIKPPMQHFNNSSDQNDSKSSLESTVAKLEQEVLILTNELKAAHEQIKYLRAHIKSIEDKDKNQKIPTVEGRKGKLEPWERNRVEEFVRLVGKQQIRVARGDLAREMRLYVNNSRRQEFYEKLVSRRGLNKTMRDILLPRRARLSVTSVAKENPQSISSATPTISKLENYNDTNNKPSLGSNEVYDDTSRKRARLDTVVRPQVLQTRSGRIVKQPKEMYFEPSDIYSENSDTQPNESFDSPFTNGQAHSGISKSINDIPQNLDISTTQATASDMTYNQTVNVSTGEFYNNVYDNIFPVPTQTITGLPKDDSFTHLVAAAEAHDRQLQGSPMFALSCAPRTSIHQNNNQLIFSSVAQTGSIHPQSMPLSLPSTHPISLPSTTLVNIDSDHIKQQLNPYTGLTGSSGQTAYFLRHSPLTTTFMGTGNALMDASEGPISAVPFAHVDGSAQLSSSQYASGSLPRNSSIDSLGYLVHAVETAGDDFPDVRDRSANDAN